MCKRCGYCCSLKVKLSLVDILRLWIGGFRLKNYADKNPVNEICVRMVGKDCYFLRRNGKKSYCIAYKYRPKICRNYELTGNNEKCRGFT